MAPRNLVDIERFVLRTAHSRAARQGHALNPEWTAEAVADKAPGPVYRFGKDLLITGEAAAQMVDFLLLEASLREPAFGGGFGGHNPKSECIPSHRL